MTSISTSPIFASGQSAKIHVMTDLNVSVEDTVDVTDDVTLQLDSAYLILANRKRCQEVLEKPKKDWADENIIDVYIALHLVLEVGLNGLYRQISLLAIKKTVNKLDIIKNIDNISFIDKTILFIYNSKFDFDGKIDKADEYHAVIGKLRDFTGIRNSLLHGHAITSISNGGATKESKLKQQITADKLVDQLKKFVFVMQSISFYLDCLDSDLLEGGKVTYKKQYLNFEFIPEQYR